MTRLFFHLINRTGRLCDEEGQLVPVEKAVPHAIKEIRSVLAEEVKSGKLDLHGHIEVETAAGQTIVVVPFSEAITLLSADE